MAEENLSPISAPKPPAVNPLGATTSAHASTLKLKPVIRKPTLGGGLRPGLKLPTQTALKKPTLGAAPAAAAAPAPAAPAPAPAAPAAPVPAAPAPAAMDQLKSVTQKLKGITQQIPAQGILHKTGIIADQTLTEAQKQASKSRTVRINPADVGVATAQSEAAPMKTIRIKRPGDLKPAAPEPAAEAAPAAPAAAEAAPAEAAESPTLTQRKTLKIARPTAGAVRPAGKFGVKKPGAAPAAKPAAEGEVGDIADIPDMPAAPAPAPVASVDKGVPDVPAGLAIFDLLLQVAACAGIFFLSYLLYLDAEAQWF